MTKSTGKREARMKAPEVFAEIDWFLKAGVAPELIAQELKRTPASLEMLARRWGRRDLSVMYNQVVRHARYEE